MFIVTPGSVVSGAGFNVRVEFRLPNSPTIDTTFNGVVTLSKATGPGTLSGTLTANAVNGVATFTGVSLNSFGSYTLRAVFGNIPAVVSTAIVGS